MQTAFALMQPFASEDFIQEFENYLGVPSFGEIFVGDVDYVSDFSNYEWGVLDFPLFFQAREVFAHDASFTTVKSIFDQDSKYNDVNHLVTSSTTTIAIDSSAWLMTTTRSCVLR